MQSVKPLSELCETYLNKKAELSAVEKELELTIQKEFYKALYNEGLINEDIKTDMKYCVNINSKEPFEPEYACLVRIKGMCIPESKPFAITFYNKNKQKVSYLIDLEVYTSTEKEPIITANSALTNNELLENMNLRFEIIKSDLESGKTTPTKYPITIKNYSDKIMPHIPEEMKHFYTDTIVVL